MSTEKRSFQISKNMIFHTIESQAGSIEKAILECLMNAVDAKATKVSVDIKEDGIHYSIKDNGHGFRSKEEITNCFEVFGFDHGTPEENQRTYGTFGIGRAQLWAFSKNIWETNQFTLDVDIKNKGLDYILTEKKSKTKGCHIKGEFYERQSVLDMQNINRALKKLALYLPVEFKLNGRIVNKDATSEKWDYETDNAYVKLNDTGDLSVYNLGVFVTSYPNYRFGKGGTIVSKNQLQLNTARNDILISKCSVWRSIKKYLETDIRKKNLNRKTLTDDMRKNLIMQWIAGDLPYAEISSRRLIPDVQGKYWQINAILRNNATVTVCDTNGSQVGENIHNNRIAFVFSPKILDWFDAENAEDLMATIKTLAYRDNIYELRHHNILIKDFNELKSQNSSKFIIISKEKYTRKQKAFISILEKINNFSCSSVKSYCRKNCTPAPNLRRAVLGTSKQAAAWTDASAYIAFNAATVQEMIEKDGMDGIIRLHYLAIHEYLHDNPSNDDHVHSHDFFENFHNITLHGTWHGRVFQNAMDTLSLLLKEYGKLDLSVPKTLANLDSRLVKEQEKMDNMDKEAESEAA